MVEKIYPGELLLEKSGEHFKFIFHSENSGALSGVEVGDIVTVSYVMTLKKVTRLKQLPGESQKQEPQILDDRAFYFAQR